MENEKMVWRLIAISLTLLCFIPGLCAQDFQAGINFLLGQPKGEFKENVEDLGFGIGGMFAFRPGNSPVMIGLDVEYMLYGSETRQEPFSHTIPDVTVEVETRNNILLTHALLRLQGNSGTFRPYLDGLIDMHYFFTETKVRDEDDFVEEPIASSTNQEDIAFSYGAGGGVMLLVHQKREEGSKLKEVLIDFRVRYSFGGEATYLKRGSITRENGTAIIDPLRSRTDLLTYQLGVVFSF